MAGLQYYFFPTDFLYPRPQAAPVEVTRKAAALAIQTPKLSEAIVRVERPTTLVQYQKKVNPEGSSGTCWADLIPEDQSDSS